MFKPLVLAALLLGVSPLANAQTTSSIPASSGNLSAADLGALTDARVDMIKAALQLTPDQQKYWAPIEDAIRTRATDRQTRVADAVKRAAARRDRGMAETIRQRDPVALLERRSNVLAQRATDLKKLADAWKPLYQTLSQEQKRRMAVLAVYVVRGIRNSVEQNRVASRDRDDD